MSAGRLLQFLGLLWVSFVMVRCWLVECSMLFQFGGLAAGGAVFLLGRALSSRGR